jgi:hypothetical protein
MSPKEAQARLETILEEVEDNSPDDWASNMAGEGLDMLYTMIGSPGFGKDSGAVDDAVAAMTEDAAARKRTQDRIRSRQKPVDTESVVVEIEGILNGLLKSPDQPQGLDNEGLKEILTQILKHLDQGFVGEPT